MYHKLYTPKRITYSSFLSQQLPKNPQCNTPEELLKPTSTATTLLPQFNSLIRLIDAGITNFRNKSIESLVASPNPIIPTLSLDFSRKPFQKPPLETHIVVATLTWRNLFPYSLLSISTQPHTTNDKKTNYPFDWWGFNFFSVRNKSYHQCFAP